MADSAADCCDFKCELVELLRLPSLSQTEEMLISPEGSVFPTCLRPTRVIPALYKTVASVLVLR